MGVIEEFNRKKRSRNLHIPVCLVSATMLTFIYIYLFICLFVNWTFSMKLLAKCMGASPSLLQTCGYLSQLQMLLSLGQIAVVVYLLLKSHTRYNIERERN